MLLAFLRAGTVQIRWHPVSIRAGTPAACVLEVHFRVQPVSTRGGKLQICANVLQIPKKRFEDANPGKFCRVMKMETVAA